MNLRTIRVCVLAGVMALTGAQVLDATIIWSNFAECGLDPGDSAAQAAAQTCGDDMEGEVSQCVIDELGLSPCNLN